MSFFLVLCAGFALLLSFVPVSYAQLTNATCQSGFEWVSELFVVKFKLKLITFAEFQFSGTKPL